MLTSHLLLFSKAEKASSFPFPFLHFLSVDLTTIVKQHRAHLSFSSLIVSACIILLFSHLLFQAVHGLSLCVTVVDQPLRQPRTTTSACRTSSIVFLCCSGLAPHQQPCWTPSFLVRLLLLRRLGAEDSGCAKSWWQGGRRCRCPADPWKLPLPCQTIETQSSYFWLSSSCKGLLFSLFSGSHLQVSTCRCFSFQSTFLLVFWLTVKLD